MNQKHITKISQLVSSEKNHQGFKMSALVILTRERVSLDDLMKQEKFNKILKRNRIYLLSTVCDFMSKSDCNKLIESEKSFRIQVFQMNNTIWDQRRYVLDTDGSRDSFKYYHNRFRFIGATDWSVISSLSIDILWDIIQTFVKLNDEILLKLLESIMSDDEFRYYKLFN